MKFGKWIGGGIGFAFGGPIGAIMGLAIGAIYDEHTKNKGQQQVGNVPTSASDFTISILVLSAAVMKADGKLLKSELDFIKKFFVKQFGEETTLELMQVFKEILKQDINLYEVCGQINHYMNSSEKLQLVHYLFGIALSDGELHDQELSVIQVIARYFGMSDAELNSIKAMFVKSTNSAYQILELDTTATDEDVKKAYRRLANTYHPDKVSHLGPEHQNAAKEKFQQLNDAYEKVKKERGIK